jgi:hypothetical protein
MSKLDAVRNSSYSRSLSVIVLVLVNAVYIIKWYYDDRDSRNMQKILNALAIHDCVPFWYHWYHTCHSILFVCYICFRGPNTFRIHIHEQLKRLVECRGVHGVTVWSLVLRFRIPLWARMFVSCVCCVLCRYNLCGRLITHSEEFYRTCMCVCLCVCVWFRNLNIDAA